MGVHYVVLFTLHIYAIIHNTKAKTCLHCVIIIMNDSVAFHIFCLFSFVLFFIRFHKLRKFAVLACSLQMLTQIFYNLPNLQVSAGRFTFIHSALLKPEITFICTSVTPDSNNCSLVALYGRNCLLFSLSYPLLLRAQEPQNFRQVHSCPEQRHFPSSLAMMWAMELHLVK